MLRTWVVVLKLKVTTQQVFQSVDIQLGYKGFEDGINDVESWAMLVFHCVQL